MTDIMDPTTSTTFPASSSSSTPSPSEKGNVSTIPIQENTSTTPNLPNNKNNSTSSMTSQLRSLFDINVSSSPALIHKTAPKILNLAHEHELGYHDIDHRYAHGLVNLPSSPSSPSQIRKTIPVITTNDVPLSVKEAQTTVSDNAFLQVPSATKTSTTTTSTRKTSSGAVSLNRSRTLTSSDERLYNKHAQDSASVEARKEKHWRRRRGSHDEKAVSRSRKFLIDVEETKHMILEQEDTDGNCQITIEDTGPKTFSLGTATSGGYKKFDIRGTYMLSNLLQELALARDYNRKYIILDEERLNENPVDRMHRLIKYHFWDSLTRRIDAEGLELICRDPKNRSKDQKNRVYVPFHDHVAFEYYTTIALERPHLDVEVVRLPEWITPEYVKSINEHPGILSLALKKYPAMGDVKERYRGVPFVVPGGRFNEMYGWDSYFEVLGLLADGRIELSKSMVENFIYQLEHYGKILNANRSYYLTRSQPPFFTDMFLSVLFAMEKRDIQREKDDAMKRVVEFDETKSTQNAIERYRPWLITCLRAAIKELFSVWLSYPRLDTKTGLTKYYPEGIGMPPETESSHFNHILEPYAEKHNVDVEEFKIMYSEDKVLEPELDAYFKHDRAVRESGHDTTYRFEKKCAYLATIDLNSLLFKYAKDIGEVIEKRFGGSFIVRVRKGPENAYYQDFLKWQRNVETKGVAEIIGGEGHCWNCLWSKGVMCYYDLPEDVIRRGHEQTNSFQYAKIIPESDGDDETPYFNVMLSSKLFTQVSSRIQTQVCKFLYNPETKRFYDYNTHTQELCAYESVTMLWPLWAGLVPQNMADELVPKALELFEVCGGLVSGTEMSRGVIGLDMPSRQWDYPYGWAPHQMMAWVGLRRYGFHKEAQRLAYRWLYTIVKSFVDFNGVVPEKFDVVAMTHQVLVEYGNVGTDFRYINREGFGWMNASFQVGLQYLDTRLVRALGTLTPPSKIFPEAKV